MAKAVYEIVWSGVLAGQFVQTVQHLQGDEDGNVNGFDRASNIIAPTNFEAINTAFMECLPAAYTLTSVRARRVLGGNSPTAVRLASEYATNAGTRDPNISAAQVNPVILWIPIAEPTRLGKLFIPGVGEEDIDNMMLAGAAVTAYMTFVDAWIAGLTVSPDDYKGTVARRQSVSPYAVIDGDLILFGQISPLIGTQRRRLRPI